jgi:Tyrosine-protein kinase ephrin type A/B receptor-like
MPCEQVGLCVINAALDSIRRFPPVCRVLLARRGCTRPAPAAAVVFSVSPASIKTWPGRLGAQRARWARRALYRGCRKLVRCVCLASFKTPLAPLGVILVMQVSVSLNMVCCRCLIYLMSRSRTVCDECGAGFYSSASPFSSCFACSVGLFVSDPGSTVCVKCMPGYYQSSTGQSACTACSFGFASNISGLGEPCAACSPGLFSNVTGSIVCTACAIGLQESNPGVALL